MKDINFHSYKSSAFFQRGTVFLDLKSPTFLGQVFPLVWIIQFCSHIYEYLHVYAFFSVEYRFRGNVSYKKKLKV